MRRRIALLLALVAAVAGVGYWWRPRAVDVRQVKRTALRLRQQGKLHEFVRELDRIPAESPDKARAYFEQGRAYWELSRGRDLEAALAKCIALESDSANPTDETLGAWGTLGDHFVGQERFDEAREVIWNTFDARRRVGPPDAFYLILLLRLRFESAEPAVAIQRLREFLANDPNDFDSHRAMGLYQARSGALEEAREHLERAVQARPDVPRFLDSYLWFLFHTNDMDEASRVLDQLPAACESHPEFWVYRGKLADYQGDSAAALEHYRKAVALDPKRMDANNLLAQALRKTGNKQEFESQIALCQQLGTAFRELSGRYAVLRSHQGSNPDGATCEQVGTLCRQLGWEREAQAWLSLTDRPVPAGSQAAEPSARAHELLKRALAYRRETDGLAFERSIADCLALDPDPRAPNETTRAAWALLADHYAIQQRWDELRAILWRLYEAVPDVEQKKNVLLRLIAPDNDRFDSHELVRWHGPFVERNAADVDSRRALGVHLALIGRIDEAREHLEQCVRGSSPQPRFAESWLWFLFLTEAFDRAAEYIDQLPDALRTRPEIWMYRGRLCEIRQEWPEAAECFRQAVQLGPDRLDARHRLAQALRAAQLRSEATEQTRVTKEIAEATQRLLDMRERLLRDRIVPDTDSCAMLAELCRASGRSREAQAWSSLE